VSASYSADYATFVEQQQLLGRQQALCFTTPALAMLHLTGCLPISQVAINMIMQPECYE